MTSLEIPHNAPVILKPSLRGRSFQITLNEPTKWNELKAYITSSKMMTYIIACKEKAPTTGHEHIHCYVHYNSNKQLSIKKLHGAHVEICRGTPQQNIEYIRKDGNIIFEQGDEPHQGGSLTIRELRSIENSDDLPDWKQYNTWLKMKQQPIKTKVSDWYKSVTVYYIQGPSGIGKSRRAVELMLENGVDEFDEVKHKGEFWHGTSGEGCCVYDDFRDSHMKASEFINFIDYNVHNLNIKGGSVRNRYTLIIITSVQPIDSIYSNMDDEPKQQWLRRVKVIAM